MEILRSQLKIVNLSYCNYEGSYYSDEIGEQPKIKPKNLVPIFAKSDIQ